MRILITDNGIFQTAQAKKSILPWRLKELYSSMLLPLVNWLVLGSIERPNCKPILVLRPITGRVSHRDCSRSIAAILAFTSASRTSILFCQAYSTQRLRSHLSCATEVRKMKKENMGNRILFSHKTNVRVLGRSSPGQLFKWLSNIHPAS